MTISVLDQIRTPQGRYPVRDAAIVRDGEEPLLSFAFRTPEELAAAPDDGASGIGLEDIGVLSQETLVGLARATGPLFGPAPRELVADWQSAAGAALVAMEIQEAVNGAKPIGLVNQHVSTTRVKNPGTGNDFNLYALSLPLPAGELARYRRCMPPLPWFRKFDDPAAFDYAFASVDEEDGASFLSVVLLSFSEEIAFADFAAAVACFSDDGDARALAARATGDAALLDAAAPYDAHMLDGLEAHEATIDESDRPALQRLVHALISLHAQGISVDPFRASAEEGFLVFDTYLSYLWYRFSKGLDRVEIGYCEQCGTAFSLAGHRGIQRRFCSERCKTQAKNARTKQRTNEARQLFEEGRSVKEIARILNGREPSRAQIESVRASLARWVDLKHRVDADLRANRGAPLARRCLDEGVFTEDQIGARIRALGIAR